MDMTGEQLISAPRAKVWEALNDPLQLQQAIPGCKTVEKTSDTEFTATVVAKVGPVSATFKGKVTLSNLRANEGYSITGEGAGGAAGFGKGGAEVTLEDAPGGGTLLKYAAHASVGGKLAQIGSRLIDGAARKMADDFFSRFGAMMASQNAGGGQQQAEAPKAQPQQQQQAQAPVAPMMAPAPARAPAPAPVVHAAPTKDGGIPGYIWFAGVMILTFAVIYAVSQTPS